MPGTMLLAEAKGVVKKSGNVTFEQAAALPTSALIAFRALIKKGKLQAPRGQAAAAVDHLAAGAEPNGSCQAVGSTLPVPGLNRPVRRNHEQLPASTTQRHHNRGTPMTRMNPDRHHENDGLAPRREPLSVDIAQRTSRT